MKEIDNFTPFDTQTLKPMDQYEWIEVKRIVNALVAEVKELKKCVS